MCLCLCVDLSVCEPTPTLCLCASVVSPPTTYIKQPIEFCQYHWLDSPSTSLCLSTGSTHGPIVCNDKPVLSPWWILMHPDISTGFEQSSFWCGLSIAACAFFGSVTSGFQLTDDPQPTWVMWARSPSSHYRFTYTMTNWLQWWCECSKELCE